ncbi:Uracil-DNA glycosylase [BD1-7 clade bacterium]|uniref:Uracil-DNA glycosylase n=1 Tax=BD1-7 clade bacterium TaxID=2029982 RepID=A0A5S9N1F0_9GAMM|nr:Uracil-DNA glycosylase [BD1-7 clade bacterium]
MLSSNQLLYDLTAMTQVTQTIQGKRSTRIHSSWLPVLQTEFDMPYMQDLRDFLQAEKTAGKTIYPKGEHIFAAFDATPLDQVKVVILGQDPYHGDNQAHGLSFSVPPGERVPPSLVNIYKELHADTGFIIPQHGNLESWAQQGVLLLNSVLTVEQAKAASHQNRGWETFTDAVVDGLNQHRSGLVFMLWGAYAQRKGKKIDRSRHLVLEAPHPSPLSAHRGFLGCRHFSQANQYLQAHGEAPIHWRLNP